MSNKSVVAQTGTLNEDAVPGTIPLVDIEGILGAKHASGENSDVVLVPTPSDGPEDPLNWSPRRKLLSSFCLSVYTLVSCQ
jgi:hypothetical protein